MSIKRLIPFLLGLPVLAPLPLARAQDAHFFVSPRGDDRWTGRAAAPNADGTDGPFATLARAREAVRKLKPGAKPGAPIVVRLRGGRYELKEPIQFTPEDSGTAATPIVYAAYPGETPILSGGRRITGWKREGSGGLWQTTLPDVKSGGWTFRDLVGAGRRCSRPRLPREGFFTVAGYAGIDQKKYDTPSDRFEFRPGDIRAAWKNLGDVECVVLHFWVDTHLRIASVDETAKVVTFDRFSRRRFSDDYRGAGARYYIDNVFEALDTPGQFYLDRPSGVLRYRPRDGETMTEADVIAPRLDKLIVFAGEPDKERFVEHIHLQGLTFSDTTWTLPAKDAGDGQAASTVPGAISAVGARHCAIEECVLRHLGSYAIELREGCRDNRVVRAEISHCGAGGIRLTGGAAGTPERLRTGGNTITDNNIHHLGETFHSGVGVLSMHSDSNTISHNHIHHLYYTGISVGWVWGYGPSVSRDNRVEFNDIHDIGQGLLSDMGGVYLLGVAPGTVVRNNRIHDVDSWSYGGWGIYTDEGSTGVLIENNLVYRTKSGGFHQHYGKDNIIRNNIFALARTEQIARSRKEDHRSFTFERNIVYYREGALLGKNWDGPGFQMDHNLYFNAAGKPVVFPGGDLASWQKRGHDRGSLIADPRFTVPDRADFSLAPESPALKLGFRPLDMTRVGPRPRP
ncbi:MAG: right-handed parallel beta-helix repeat-containing protein [Gemmataceae bacterium]